jgi:Flp pilus assembly pilin Flp
MFEKLKWLYAWLYTQIYSCLPRFLRDCRGVTGLVLSMVVALVTIAILIPIGLLVTTNIGDSLSLVSSKTANTTVAQNVTYDVFQNVYQAFSLSALTPIIAVAGLLIAIIVGAFAFRMRA